MSSEDIEAAAGALHPLAGPIADALTGAVFPLDRSELILVARENDTPPMILSLVSSLPERRFASAADVQAALEERAPGESSGPA